MLEALLVGRTSAYRIAHWTPAQATVEKIEANGRGEYSTRGSYQLSLEEVRAKEVILKYADAAGKEHSEAGYLSGVTKLIVPPNANVNAKQDPSRFVHPGSKIEILYDPENPQRWTDRTVPEPLIEQLIVPLIPVPLLLILVIGFVVQRGRLTRLLQTGVVRDATVVGTARSAAAPRSAVIRCAVNGAQDKRVTRVTVPLAAAQFEPGDTIRVITPPGNAVTPTLAAMLYE